jgi:diguanylate cyclase (GGDEF)-like protein/PAS domain S-box-containing protein
MTPHRNGWALVDAHVDYSTVVDNLHDGLYLVDHARRIIYWNKAAERITGFSADEVLGRGCSDNILVHVNAEGTSLCAGLCPLSATLRDHGTRETSVFLHHKLGHRLPVSVRVTPLLDSHGAVMGAVELFSDSSSVEALRARMAVLEHLSLIDPLTQLPNRRYVQSELEAQLAMLRRTGVPYAVAMLDIDHFTQFNDEFGHDVGDQALQVVARTLSSVVRPFDVVGRWGGEEFVGIFPNTAADSIEGIVSRLCQMVRRSRVEYAGGHRSITVSAGATAAKASDTVTTLLRRADTLMYASKRSGRDRLSTDDATCAARLPS